MQQLSHERLEVYQKAVEFLALAVKLIDTIPRGNQTIVDQLRIASISTVLNIAEAAGHPYVQKRRNHYAIDRGSALECGAALDTCKVLEIGDQNIFPTGKALLVSVVSMLSRMCKG